MNEDKTVALATPLAEEQADKPTSSTPPGDRPPTPRAASPARRWLWLAVALLLIASAVGAALTAVQVRDQRRDQAGERTALAAGRTAAVAFTSYDYRHLHRDLTQVEDMSTGTFRTQFGSALTALTRSITAAHGVSVGTVVDAGLVSHTDTSAVVIAAVDAAVTNKASKTATTRRYRLQITLNRDSGTWLISDITPVA